MTLILSLRCRPLPLLALAASAPMLIGGIDILDRAELSAPGAAYGDLHHSHRRSATTARHETSAAGSWAPRAAPASALEVSALQRRAAAPRVLRREGPAGGWAQALHLEEMAAHDQAREAHRQDEIALLRHTQEARHRDEMAARSMAQKAAAAGRAAAGRSALVPPDDATDSSASEPFYDAQDSSTSEPFYDAQDSSTSPPFYETGMLGNGQNYDQQPRHGQDPHYDQQPLDGQEPHYGQDLDRIDHEAVTMGHMGSDSHVEHMRHSTRGTGHADGESRMIHSLDNPPPRPEPDADGKFDPVAYKAYEDYVVNAERLVATAERTYETSKLNAEGKVAEEPKEQKVPLYLKNMGDEVAEKEEESGLMCFIFIAIICSVACFVLANPGDDRPKEPAAGQEVRQDVQGNQEVANSSDSQGLDQDLGPQDLGGEDRGPQDPGGEDDGAEVLQGEQDPGGEQGDAVDQGQGEEGLEEL